MKMSSRFLVLLLAAGTGLQAEKIYNLQNFIIPNQNTIHVGDIISVTYNPTTTPYEGKISGAKANNFFREIKNQHTNQAMGASTTKRFKAIKSTNKNETGIIYVNKLWKSTIPVGFTILEKIQK